MRRGAFVLVLVGVLLVVGALFADRLARGRAETVVAEQVRAELGVLPEVRIEGFPFLTQLLAQELDSVQARAAELPVEGVVLTDVVADARALTWDPVVIGRLDVEATIAQAELQRLVDERVSAVALTVTTTARGIELSTEVLGLPLTALGRPEVSGPEVDLRLESLTLGGVPLPADRLAPLLGQDLTTVALDLPELPLGLTVVGARTDDAGVRLALQARQAAL